MPSKDTIAKKETAAVEGSESSERAPPDSNDAALEGTIDLDTFDQILEMDDNEEREFSRTIVEGFLEQAEKTFQSMSDSLKMEDLAELSSLGHFLKGSSATLGLLKVKQYCETIQNLGSGKDETGTTKIDDREAGLRGIKSALSEMKKEYECVRKRFNKYYDDLDGDSQL